MSKNSPVTTISIKENLCYRIQKNVSAGLTPQEE